MGVLVTVVVPIYNVERHIAKCVQSLFAQSYHDIEYIFVDDCASDGSIAILKSVFSAYPIRASQSILIQHEHNKGLPTARNTGLALASGKYVLHFDSDDYADERMIFDMLERAEQEDADITYADFYLSFEKNRRYMEQPYCTSPEDCLKALFDGRMKFNVWNKLVKRSLYERHHITFPDGISMGEDMTMIKLFCVAGSIAYLPKAYYNYMQTNTSAFTKSFSKKQAEDILLNTESIVKYVQDTYPDKRFNKELNFFKLNVKLPFLISTDVSMYTLWRNWFPEANAFIKENKAFSGRIKFVQIMAMREQDWVVRLYNYVVVRLVYGVIYR